MQTIAIILAMIAAVIISSWIVRMLPFPIPLPIVQIVLGYLIAQFLGGLSAELNPHVFMFLFLPPLLFLDGWRLPKDALKKDLGTITQLAFGLVFFTVLGIGLLIYWMIPEIPLPVAFALAAVISPTDPVAVSAIAQKVPFPSRMMHILEGESLFNDASGLVCLKFAVAATLTGAFSLTDASFEFVKMVVRGLVVGLVVALGITRLKQWISRHWGEDSGTQILISLLIPFLAYIIAEHWHFSGVLGAVAAGITMSYSELHGKVMAVTRIRRNAVWDSLQMIANGAMFVLLGEQLPKIVGKMHITVQQAGHTNITWLFLYVAIIFVALAVLRWLWVWASLKVMMIYFSMRGSSLAPVDKRLIAAMSLSGVRGSITLAGVLSLPLLMNDNFTPFPARDLAIFLASGVILISLIVASVALPRILNGLALPKALDNEENDQENRARIAAAEAAIKAIEHAQHEMSAGSSEPDLYIEAANRVMNTYRNLIDVRSHTAAADAGTSAATVRKSEEIQRQIRLAALAAERDDIYRQSQEHLIDHDLMDKLMREVDLEEARIAS